MALDEYIRSKGESCPIYDTDYQDTDASDLIADLLHLQKHLKHNVEITLMHARMHYEGEQVEHAGINLDVPVPVITIEVKGGMVTDVCNLPAGWGYKINDLDER
jgi:hypothetical protein